MAVAGAGTARPPGAGMVADAGAAAGRLREVSWRARPSRQARWPIPGIIRRPLTTRRLRPIARLRSLTIRSSGYIRGRTGRWPTRRTDGASSALFTHRYKRPPGKRKPVEIEQTIGPLAVGASGSTFALRLVLAGAQTHWVHSVIDLMAALKKSLGQSAEEAKPTRKAAAKVTPMKPCHPEGAVPAQDRRLRRACSA
jgi:hypothetical protein